MDGDDGDDGVMGMMVSNLLLSTPSHLVLTVILLGRFNYIII